MCKIVLVETGNYCGRGIEYVQNLTDMVARSASRNLEFIIFSDTNYSWLGSNVTSIMLDKLEEGWWNKLKMFQTLTEGEYLYIDLDSVILGDICEIMPSGEGFTMCSDFAFEGRLNSSIMYWSGDYSHLYNTWVEQGKPTNKHGDQYWIQTQIPFHNLSFQQLYPNKVKSYKGDKVLFIPDNEAVIVCFHGNPRPHEVLDTWVGDFWKKNGFVKPRFVSVVNADHETLVDNVAYAHNLDIPYINKPADAHDKKLCIVGGGPSLRHDIPILKSLIKEGYHIWSLNGTYRYLQSVGIIPDALVMLDARPENAEFVAHATGGTTYYIGSQCHRSVFDSLLGRGLDVFGWDANSTYTKGRFVINGGTTVGLKAMNLAFALGYRDMSLFGFDSSYEGEINHAYDQPLNDNEKRINIVVKGREFNTAVWMARQAQLAMIQIPTLINKDTKVSVYGDGLLPWCLFVMTQLSSID